MLTKVQSRDLPVDMASNPPAVPTEQGPAADWLMARFSADKAAFHLGGSSDWSVSPETLHFLARNLPAHARTLETGAGLSTALFALLGARHICVCPDETESARIRDFCTSADIDLGGLSFLHALSEDALPSLKAEPLDLVLIDGGHGFPMPIIDWYYTASKLKVGGVLVIDDTHLWSCGMLVDFLKSDAGWASMGRIGRRTYAFRKTAPFAYNEFCFQPYVMRRSRLSSMTARVLVAWDLLASGQFAEFGRRLRKG